MEKNSLSSFQDEKNGEMSRMFLERTAFEFIPDYRLFLLRFFVISLSSL